MQQVFSILVLLCFLPPLSAQQWDTLPAIPEALTFPVAAVVDGKIHIMGGGGTGGATDAHYRFDPETETWETLAPVPYLAQQPAGAAVNGMIHYFGGGYPNSGSPLDDHHIYDPATDTWTQATSLTAPRAIHYAVNLDEVLYSLAGQGMANLCQIYDPVDEVWITKNNLPDNSFWYGAHVPHNGHIYRFCGGGYTAPVANAHKYDPGTDTWVVIPSVPNAIHALRGAAIGDEIYLVGGYFNFLDRAEVLIYDVNTQTYSEGTPLPLGRSYHNLAAVDSCLYVLGGNHAIDQTVRTQLLRFCPYEGPSTVEEPRIDHKISTSYYEGVLRLELPEEIRGDIELNLYDLTGRLVFNRSLVNNLGQSLEIRVDGLAPAVYFLKIKTEKDFFTSQFAAF